MERTMTESPAWREFESGDGVLLQLLRFGMLGIGIFFLVFAGILELIWPQQAVLGLLTVLPGIWMDRSPTSYLVTLTLMLSSMYSTFRYGFWRFSTTVNFFTDPGSRWSGVVAAASKLLLSF
jgi:cellulose synthase (UDP-forming)